MIGKCKARCNNEGQDKLHGPANRVLNHIPGTGKTTEKFRCTVCGTIHEKADVKPR